MKSIPVGADRAPSPVYEVRTAAQRDTVAAIVSLPGFGFASSTPFGELTARHEANGYYETGPFRFIWVDTDGYGHSDEIGKDGEFIRRVTF